MPRLKRNLVSISVMEDKGFRVAFIDGKVLACSRNSSMREAFTLGVRNEGLYRVCGRPIQALVDEITNQCEVWHQRFSHLHYKDFPNLNRMVTGIHKIQVDHERKFQDVLVGRISRDHSLLETTDLRRFFILFILIFVGP